MSPVTSFFSAPLRMASWAKDISARPSFGFFARKFSKRFLASVGFLSAISNTARFAAASKFDESIVNACSKLFRAAVLSFCASWSRPRRLAARGLPGCFAASLSMATSALSNSLRFRCAFINARSATVPLSDPATSLSSSRAIAVCPVARWAIASAVRLPTFLGSSFNALAKYCSAFFASPV